MAFQAPSALTHAVSFTSEMWPSMKSSLLPTWVGFRRSAATRKNLWSDERRTNISTAAPPAVKATPASDLLECLASPHPTLLRSLQFGRNLTASALSGTFTISSSKILCSANPFGPGGLAPPQSTRHFSTSTALKLPRHNRILPPNFALNLQRRTMFGGSTSTNLLAHMEQTANNNPSSATAQNAFYTALLRAEMPAIVVQRYQSGRYATSPAVVATYERALEKIGQIGTSLGSNALPKTSSNLTSEQLQAVGQAIAASSQGGHIGVVRGKNGQASTGAKESPLYVVVEESIGSSLFKWVKFFLYFGLVAWLVSMIFTFAVEATGAIKKVSGTQNNEAQPQHQTARFSDVHGCDEAKEELQELVEFLKAPEKFSSLGGKLPKGVLLVGPPGTGKTLLARAVAGESGVPFFFMSGAEFDEIYVGVGAKRVRDLFSNARAKAPAIIFIDELDAIGGKRNERDPAYVKQSLNQLLTELDGFSQETGVVIIAATNFPQLLDQALTRPGRFDRNVVVPLPDVRGRVDILDHHMKNIRIAPEVDSTIIARGTPGFSGAELENLVNQAAVRASRNKSKSVGPEDLEWAKDKIIMGAERRSAIIQEKDKIMTAYHEGGHALVALLNPDAYPVYKATIMPRGQTLGMTTMLPEMDIVSQAKKEFLAQIDVSMGGKVAEEVVYGSDSVSSGCASDLQHATQTAFSMVTKMGMSEILGNVDLYSQYDRLSSATKQKIEGEVRRILDESYQRAYKVITERRKELDLLAHALVEYEVLNADEMRLVLKGEKLPKLKSSPNAPIKLPELKLPPGLGGGPPALPPGLVGGPSGLGGEPSGLGEKVPGLEGAHRSRPTAGADPRGPEPGESGGAEL